MRKEQKREIGITVILFAIIMCVSFAASYFLDMGMTRKMEHGGIILSTVLVAVGLIRYIIGNRKRNNQE